MCSGARTLKSIQNILNKTLKTISKEQQEIFNLVLEHKVSIKLPNKAPVKTSDRTKEIPPTFFRNTITLQRFL